MALLKKTWLALPLLAGKSEPIAIAGLILAGEGSHR